MKGKDEKIVELKGANMDIDLLPNQDVSWEIDKCPWNEAEGKDKHKCAVKNAFSSQMRHQVIPQQEVKRLTYPQQSQNPLDVLKMQVVMNEISEEEFKRKRAVLEGNEPTQIEQSINSS